MSKPSILIQLDTDPQPSVFDAVVAVDAGVDHLFRHGSVTPANVTGLIHGGLFTRGPSDLHRTAVFVGGSNVAAAEEVLKAVRAAFFGPFQLSVLFDPNGSNTTAAAAVLAAIQGCDGSVSGREAVVLGGTGPVGLRAARLLARLGARVAITSRSVDRARAAAERVRAETEIAVGAFANDPPEALAAGMQSADLVINAGAAGVCILPAELRKNLPNLRVAIDLNAVPPLGIEGVDLNDKDTVRDGARCWGALGVGGTKMKIHKKALQEIFTSNDKILDAEEILRLGQALG